MDINDLKLFARAAELGNITHAAAELGYTQSAASHALRRLEQNLGTQLLQRLHMGVCLTEMARNCCPMWRPCWLRRNNCCKRRQTSAAAYLAWYR